MGRKKTIFLHQKHLPRNGQLQKRRIHETSQRNRFLKRRTGSTPVSSTLDIYSGTLSTILQNTWCIPFSTIETKALIDCGAGETFINQNFAKNFDIQKLEKPITAKNVDKTINKKGTVKSYVELEFAEIQRTILCHWTGKTKNYTWFPLASQTQCYYQLENWKNHLERLLTKFLEMVRKEETNSENNNRKITGQRRRKKSDTNAIFMELYEEINMSKIIVATELAIKEDRKKEEKTDKELIPEEYHKYLNVFSKEKAAWFPESKPWDYKIKIKEGFELKSFKNYNLTPAEQLKLDNFFKENLDKGYIQPSESPMALPFFFVSKKDGKLWPCQDYQYLNEQKIKNSYPLPLILDIMDKLKGAKYSTKINVCWGYNNIQIHKGDEWKVAFKTNKGLFEPMVMFFGIAIPQ